LSPVGQTVRFYRPFMPMSGGIFFCLFGVGASLATLPFYVSQQLHGSKREVGIVVAGVSVAVVISRPVAGRFADGHGYKRVMIIGTLTCTLAGAAYFGGRNVPILVCVRILNGIGEGTTYTAGAAWLVSLCPPERRGRIVGMYGIYMWLGTTLGALFGTVAMHLGGFSAVWALCTAVGAAGFLSVVSAPVPARPAGGARARSSILPASTVVPGIALSLAALGYGALAAFVVLDMAARGVSDGIAAFTAFGFTYVGVRLVIGHLPDRLRTQQVALWSALVEAVGLIVVAVATNLTVVIVGGLIMGAGLSLLFPSLALLVINRTEPSQQGAALGAFTSFWDIGVAVGGPFAALIFSLAGGYPAIYFVMAGCAVASALLSVARARMVHPQPPAPAYQPSVPAEPEA